jgi:Protein phosphatase 2C
MTWHVVAASVTGEAHLKQGKGNEDAYCLASRLNGALVLAVADGAGSASCGAEGAELATTCFISFLSELTLPTTEESWQVLMLETIQHVHNALETHAISQQKEPRDFACTLLVAVLTPSYIAALQVGDGAIVGMNDGTAIRLTHAAHGEYASETIFVTSQDYLEHCSCLVIPSETLTGIALLTDGLEPVAMNLQTDEPFLPFFTPLFQFACNEKESHEKSQALTSFLASERLKKRTHDDKTLVLAVRS